MDVRFPTWVDSTSILVYTGFYIDGTWVRGLFKISIEAETLTYRGYEPYAFDNDVYAIEVNRSTGELFVRYDYGGFRVARVRLENERTIVEEELVAPAWKASGIAAWPRRNGIVFYGKDPFDDRKGFYWSRGEALSDSLLLSANVRFSASQQWAIDAEGRNLYFFVVSEDWVGHLVRTDLTAEQKTLDTLLTRDCGLCVTYCRAHPMDRDVTLFQLRRGGHDEVSLLNANTGSARRLNLGTSDEPCSYTITECASWSPDGRHVAFSARRQTGQSGAFATLEL
jgi:hypothetical protein